MTFAPFNNARGAASSLQMAPPFAFSDVTMSVFPLRASLPTLENFCRNYLNPSPDLVQFRPFIPYVYLVILDYGQMSLEAANTGWVSQREVAFGIPLRWLIGGPNGPEFHDWAFTSPFIFVDNALSMSTGREVYGWPKLLARLDPSVSQWVRDPHGARRVFQVSTKGAGEGYAGETSDYHNLLSVYQHRTAGMLDVPPSLSAITKPLSQMPNVAASLTRLSMDLSKTFLGMASDRITGSAVLPDMTDLETFRAQLDPERMKAWTNAKEWVPGLKDAMWSMFPRLYANTINLKQFRDATEPQTTCYQAITAARMPVKSVKEGGFLGPQNMLLGQLDGGFHIDIHHVAGLPIVESLGLEVASVREQDNRRISTLVPVAPLWMKVDMTYGLADTVIWRGRKMRWNEGKIIADARKAAAERREKEQTPDEVTKEQTKSAIRETRRIAEEATKLAQAAVGDELDDGGSYDYIRAMNIFNTARGASEAVGGAFSVPDASIRVLPIKADPKALRAFARDLLRVEGKMRFEAWGDFVYLVISDFKQMNSQQSALAKRSAREMSFMVPVKGYEWFADDAYPETGTKVDRDKDRDIRSQRGKEKLLTTGFVNAFTYVDDVQTAITANEVFGVPSMGSVVQTSENDWLSRDFGTQEFDETILKMKAQVLPELMVGAEAIERTIVALSGHRNHRIEDTIEPRDKTLARWVELLNEDMLQKRVEANEFVETTAQTQASDIQRKAYNSGQGLALGLLAGELPFNQFSLKQFRDSNQTQNACYQALVLRRHKIRKLTDLRELSGPLHVTITDFPTQPITKILGLKPKYSFPGTDRIVHVFEPIRPFSLNGEVLRGEGVTLFERVESEAWEEMDVADQMFGWRKVDFENWPYSPAYLSEKADELVPFDLLYEFKHPSQPHKREVRKRNASAKDVRKWFDIRVEAGRVDNIMIKQRNHADTIGVLADKSTLRKTERNSSADLSARYKYATGQRYFSQSELAGLIERISPATVADTVLSRQWGKAQTTRLHRYRQASFCVPVSTVPTVEADNLFPVAERQGDFWPYSRRFFDAEFGRRKREVAAFRYELQAALRTIALALPIALDQKELVADSKDASQEEILHHIADELHGRRPDIGGAGLSDEFVTRVVKHAISSSDSYAIIDAIEEMAFAYFDLLLPESLSLTSSARVEKLEDLKGMLESEIELISSDEWHAAVDSIQKIKGSMADALDMTPAKISYQIDILKTRARDNAHDMEMVEAAHGRYFRMEHLKSDAAYGELITRLEKRMR